MSLLTEEEQKEIIFFIRSSVPEWQNIQDNEITFQKMGVPSANKILLVETTSTTVSKYKKLLLKMPLHNPFEELFDLQEQKMVNDMISLYRGDKGLNPKVLCINDKFRIDEFVECKNLDFSDYQDSEMMKQLARILCDFHHDVVLKEKYIKLRGMNTLPIRMLGMRNVFYQKFSRKEKNY